MPACVHKRLVSVPNDCLRANGLPVYRMSVCVQIGCLSTDACLWANRLSVYRCLSVCKLVVCLAYTCRCVTCVSATCSLWLVSSCSQSSEFFFNKYTSSCLTSWQLNVSFNYLKNVKIDFKVLYLPVQKKSLRSDIRTQNCLFVCITSKFHRTNNMGSST